MTDYNIEKIENGIATVRYADNSWAELILSSNMTETDLDDLAHQYAPKQGVAPSFATVGFKSTASAKSISEPTNPKWFDERVGAYGPLNDQIEYITENGLEAWQAKVAEIKAANPKTDE